VAEACRGVEVVFHEGALGSVPKSVAKPIDSDASNVGGTVTVLDCARHAGIRRVIFAASSSAYGETAELPKHERIVPQPLSPYAVSKLACEMYLRVFAGLYGIETLSLRYFNVFGPAQTPDGAYAAAIPRFLDRALTGRPIEIFGDGEQTRDFCFVKNTVTANLLAASTPKKLTGQAVNIAGGRRITLNDLVREIGRVLGPRKDDGGRPREVTAVHGPERPGDIRHSLGDISLARDLLGYEPSVKWEDGIAPTAEYLTKLRQENLSAASRVMAALWNSGSVQGESRASTVGRPA
jgi:UDP-glucose 4-epimerase